MKASRFKVNKPPKQGYTLIRFIIILVIAIWILASVYFFYLSPSSQLSASLSSQHHGKFEKLETFKTLNKLGESVLDEKQLSHEEHCPPVPTADYPYEWPIMDVLNNWNPDDVKLPEKHYESLCRFDYNTEKEKARTYRDKEVPFIIYNVPKMNTTVHKWSNPEYLKRKLGANRRYTTEHSTDNHFMYFSNAMKGPADWTPPVENLAMSFSDWMTFALQNINASTEAEKYYFRVSNHENEFLDHDLPMLTAKGDVDSLFLVNKKMARGIFCRFGMHGIVAAAHYDGSRNYVAIMGGLRRYLIMSPKNCEFLYLYPRGHPSGRHSRVDWSAKPIDLKQYPKFPSARVSEVVLGAGDMMYIPSGWIHYVMSLNINWQCNARSGKSKGQFEDVQKCGF